MGHDPVLTALPNQGKKLFIKFFLSLNRTATWNVTGGLKGIRAAPVVSSTVRDAASSLAAAFQYHHKLSPLLLVVRSLLKAQYDNVDPPTNQQKTITPKLLWCMHASTGAAPPQTARRLTCRNRRPHDWHLLLCQSLLRVLHDKETRPDEDCNPPISSLL
jgi:hypothetical protein